MVRATDTKMRGDFPVPPFVGSELLVPITSWPEMHRETEVTNVEFDLFWYDSVEEGAAYFFRWLGEPRSTVLVVWNNDGPTHIECRKVGDLLASDAESASIIAEVTQRFRDARCGRDRMAH